MFMPYLAGLVCECPAGERNAGCPFSYGSGNEALIKAIREFRAMNDDEISSLLARHHDCFQRRLYISNNYKDLKTIPSDDSQKEF